VGSVCFLLRSRTDQLQSRCSSLGDLFLAGVNFNLGAVVSVQSVGFNLHNLDLRQLRSGVELLSFLIQAVCCSGFRVRAPVSPVRRTSQQLDAGGVLLSLQNASSSLFFAGVNVLRWVLQGERCCCGGCGDLYWFTEGCPFGIRTGGWMGGRAQGATAGCFNSSPSPPTSSSLTYTCNTIVI
jgi:hypothetical protein